MENNNLDLMIEDFLKRHAWDASKEEILDAMKNNMSLVTEDAFFVFNIYFGKFAMFYAYVKPHSDAKVYWQFFENWAKFKGCTKLSFATTRVKAFQRCFPDYKQAGVIFEKDIS